MAKPTPIRVKQGQGRRRRRRTKKEMREDSLPNAGTRQQRTSIFTFSSVTRERWEQCFGEWNPERFRQAMEEQKKKKREAAARAAQGTSAAVHGDNKGAGRRLYRGFDWGLGAHVEGRSDRKQLMKEKGLREAR